MSINIDHKKIQELTFGQGLQPSNIINQTNISSSQFYKILNGQQKTIFDRTAFTLAKALKCDPADFSK